MRAVLLGTLLAAACSGDRPAGAAAAPAPAASQAQPVAGAAGKSKAVLELGRVICGDCCVQKVRTAFGDTKGIGSIEMRPGETDFAVEYDPTAVSAEQLAARLVAAGEPAARLSATGDRAQPAKRWVRSR